MEETERKQTIEGGREGKKERKEKLGEKIAEQRDSSIALLAWGGRWGRRIWRGVNSSAQCERAPTWRSDWTGKEGEKRGISALPGAPAGV